MGRENALEFAFKGSVCRFALAPIKREMFYGGRRRVAVDEHGSECSTALLTKDGRFLLPAGTTASLYVNDGGDAVERGELVAIDGAGRRLPDQDDEEKEARRLETSVAATELLDGVAHKVSALTPQALAPELAQSLAAGDIYRLSSRAGETGGEPPAFLLANDHGIFLLVTRSCRFEFISLDQPVIDWEEDDGADEADDYSFDFGLGGAR